MLGLIVLLVNARTEPSWSLQMTSRGDVWEGKGAIHSEKP